MPDTIDWHVTAVTSQAWTEPPALAIIAALEEEWTQGLGEERMEQLRDTLTALRDLPRPSAS